MKTRTFYSSPKVKKIALLICCLISVLILPHCTSQEKKIRTKVKTEIKDSLTQKTNIATNVDTTKGVFLIYKFGDTPEVVYQKTDHLLNKNIITKEFEKKEFEFDEDINHYFYKIIIDPKYATMVSGQTDDGGRFIADDCYLKCEMTFEYFENKLFQIELYSGLSFDEIIDNKKLRSLYKQWYTRNDILALLDVYSKKYRDWTQTVNKIETYDYYNRNGNTKISIKDNFYGVSVEYTDFAIERKIQNQEKENLNKRMDEQNKGI